MKKYNTLNMWTKYKSLPEEARNDIALQNAMRHFDHTVNVRWVMAHYNAAGKYLVNEEGEVEEATGGSDWRKYMHPRYQRRIFFPELWSQEEMDQWGVSNLEDYKKL